MEVDGRCFFINVNSNTNFEASKKECTKRLGGKGKLYEPRRNSLTEKIRWEASLRVNDDIGYYVGIKKVNGKFVYDSDGTLVSKSLKWADGYPVPQGDCVQMVNGKLINSDCGVDVHEICEYDRGILF